MSRPGAQWWLPEHHTPEVLRSALKGCRGCELHDTGRETPGRGPLGAAVMVVADAPVPGAPAFDTPLWQLIDTALRRGGLDPDQAYRTHLVKHPHLPGCRDEVARPGLHGCGHAVACTPWLWAEVAMIQPDLVVLINDDVVWDRQGQDRDDPRRDGEHELTWPPAATRWTGGECAWVPRRCLVIPEPPDDGDQTSRGVWIGRLASLAHLHGHQRRGPRAPSCAGPRPAAAPQAQDSGHNTG